MNFNRLAPFYQTLESVCAGKKMHRCRVAFLEALPAAEHVLLLGEGPGRSLLEYGQRFPAARITCVDGSAAMLDRARRQGRHLSAFRARVHFVHADLENWLPPESRYDLVVTHFFLDCFRREQLPPLIRKIARAARPAANWLVADFQLAASGWKRLRSRLILWGLYQFFRVSTRLPARSLTNPDPFLQAAGFHLVHRKETEWQLLRSDWWQRSSHSPVDVPSPR